MIKVQQISKSVQNSIKKIKILKKISFIIKDGSFVIITGRSGSGKSTLLHLLGLLDTVDSGKIIIDQIDTTHLTQHERTEYRLNHFGFIFQDYGLVQSLNVEENVMLPLLMKGIRYIEAQEMSIVALKKAHLINKAHSYVMQLSGGEQQRVGIARAIAQLPQIIFADEPTANLDTSSSQKIITIFKKMNQEGQTIVMVTHEHNFLNWADQIIVLSDGRIVEQKIKEQPALVTSA